MTEYKNKVVWVTGASSGIGEALVYQLDKLGAKLVISARRLQELERVKSNCKGQVLVLTLDLLKIDELEQKVNEVIKHYGSIEVLINNGGISQRSLASETPLEIDRKIMEVNYFGNIALAKAVLPQMQNQKKGHIVVISSLSGKFGFFLRSAYSASKHALVGFYESLRLEEEKNGIIVSIVFPGLVNTNISKNALTKNGEKHNKHDKKQAEGISSEKCAKDIIEGIRKKKKEIFSGGKELKAITLKRLFPNLFFRLIKKRGDN